MNGFSLLILLFLIFMFNNSCTKKKTETDSILKIQIPEMPSDFLLPSEIWNLISPFHEVKAVHGAATDTAAKVPIIDAKKVPIIFSPITIMLVEKNEGVLKAPQILIQFPLGGGRLDLKDYLTGVVGSFYVRFANSIVDENSEEKKDKVTSADEIYFWSRGKKRKIEDAVFGSGCNKIMELSPAKMAAQDSMGIKVNTKNDRYISVIGGHYFFVKRREKDILLSQIEITNSDLAVHLCDAVSAHKNTVKGVDDDSSSENE